MSARCAELLIGRNSESPCTSAEDEAWKSVMRSRDARDARSRARSASAFVDTAPRISGTIASRGEPRARVARAPASLMACHRAGSREDARRPPPPSPSTSPTARRARRSRRRARLRAVRRRRTPTTGTPHASASSALRPNDSRVAGQQEEIGAGEQRRDVVDLAEEEHVVRRRRAARASSSASTRSGPSPTITRTRRHLASHAREDPHDVAHALHRRGSSRCASGPCVRPTCSRSTGA